MVDMGRWDIWGHGRYGDMGDMGQGIYGLKL
jgi:hypothetical protein